jgi:hypothetical protein
MKGDKSYRFRRTATFFVPCIAFCLLLAASQAGAVEFAGGTGEPNDPYQIATAEQLIAIGSDLTLCDKCFALTADIDLDPNLPGGTVFEQAVVRWERQVARRSIGSAATSSPGLFEGSFDGRGHAIRNCVILCTNTTAYPGIFESILCKGVVRNLRVEDILIANLITYGTVHCGSLTTRNEGTIINCSATGTLLSTESPSNMCGGLVGFNMGIMVNCCANCDAFGDLTGGLVGSNTATGRLVRCTAGGIIFGQTGSGGLAGSNDGTIQYCSANGDVRGGSTGCGGLVATNTGTIRESYAAAAVHDGGGLVSVNSGTIANCYTSPLPAGTCRDGMVATNKGTILSSYSMVPSQIQSTGPVRRSLGVQSDMTALATAIKAVRYVYYLNSDTSTASTVDSSYGYGTPLSDAEMKQAASFVGFDFYGDPNDGPAGPWFMPKDGYPVLTWQREVTGLTGIPDVSGLDVDTAKLLLETTGLVPGAVTSDYSRLIATDLSLFTEPAGCVTTGTPVGVVVSLGAYDFTTMNPGDGSQEDPYQISTPGQLDSLYSFDGRDTYGDTSSYVLTDDIDLSPYVYQGPVLGGFRGEFNGNGHAIRNLQITVLSLSGNCYGLFDILDSTARIHDLTLSQVSLLMRNQTAVGGLVGRNTGQVVRCNVSGRILGGRSNVGGIAGDNSGQMTDCRFTGRIHAADNSVCIGGLAGSNRHAILRCCARDIDVSGTTTVGGLVGGNASSVNAPIEACYATGQVRGTSCIGGLLGQDGSEPQTVERSLQVQEQDRAEALTSPMATASNSVVRKCYAACAVIGQSYLGGCIGLAMSSKAAQESCYFLDPNDGGGPDNGLGTPLTSDQMKHAASFVDWDFVDTWTICERKDYPRLRWESVQCME